MFDVSFDACAFDILKLYEIIGLCASDNHGEFYWLFNNNGKYAP